MQCTAKRTKDSDILLADARGDQTGWFISPAKVAEALGIPEGDVRQAWEEHLDGDPRAKP